MARELDDPARDARRWSPCGPAAAPPWRRRHCSARASLRAAKLSARGTGTRKFRRMKPTSPSDLALVVALARPAEPVLEQIVGLKFREDARSLPLPIAQDAGDCQLGVVVQDGAGDAAEERNRRVVAIAGTPRSSPPGRPSRSRQSLWGRSKARKWTLRVTRRRSPPSPRRSPPGAWPGEWDERHEHLTRPKPLLTNVVLHDGVAARETVLVPEAVEDALRSVPLLAVAGPIVFQDPIDDSRERTQLWPPRRRASAIPWRHRERQHLTDRLAV